MNTSTDLALWTVLIVAAYKIACLIAGVCFAYMGYRLFITGIQQSAGNLEASSPSGSLKLSKAAPGTFFALFGAAVIATTIYQGFDVEIPAAARQVLPLLPDHPPEISDEKIR